MWIFALIRYPLEKTLKLSDLDYLSKSVKNRSRTMVLRFLGFITQYMTYLFSICTTDFFFYGKIMKYIVIIPLQSMNLNSIQ